MALALSFSQEEGDGLFLCNWAKYLKLDEELEKIEARSDLDDLSDLRNLIQREPDFLDARVSLGMHCYRNDDFGNAKAVAETGLAVANELIPARFKGTIAWLRVENRAFLRLLSLAALSNARLGRHGEALAHIMRSMKYNPDDELGLRGVLGSELLRTGEDATAKRCLANHAPDFPECFYELGLAHLLDEEWALAATALRQGFLVNPYIAEIITGCDKPMMQTYWHGEKTHMPSHGLEYMAMYDKLWHALPEFSVFVRWLFCHPVILAERAEVQACREQLLWTERFSVRKQINRKLEALLARCDHEVSERLVQAKANKRGVEMYPWMRCAGQEVATW